MKNPTPAWHDNAVKPDLHMADPTYC